MPSVKNVAIVGASGQAGTHILNALLASNSLTVTAITRSCSAATFPTTIAVHKGDYASDAFLESSLRGQDVLVVVLAGTAPKDLQSRLIRAAAAANVPWILPCEFGPDTSNPEMAEGIPFLTSKKAYRDEIERLGTSSWIGVVTGFWFDFSLKGGHFGLDVKQRTVRLYDDGNAKSSTTTLAHVGRAVAKLLSLPVDNLETYRNRFVYVQSFCVSQNNILTSLYQATGTSERDWKISKVPVEEAIANGRKEFESGNFRGLFDVAYGMSFKAGAGGDFRAKVDNGALGLELEDLDGVVKGIVEGIEGG